MDERIVLVWMRNVFVRITKNEAEIKDRPAYVRIGLITKNVCRVFILLPYLLS